MATTLNIITSAEASELLDKIEKSSGDDAGQRFDLTNSDPDYAGLVEKIFEAEFVRVW